MMGYQDSADGDHASDQDDDRTSNIYCPFCGGLVWAPVQFTAHHFDGCTHKVMTTELESKEGTK